MDSRARLKTRDVWFILLSILVLLLLFSGLLVRASPELPGRLGIPLERSLIPLHFLDLLGVAILLLFLYSAMQRTRSGQLAADATEERREAESMRLALDEVRSIFEVSSRVNAFRDLEEALPFIAHAARDCLRADRASLLLLEEEGELVVRAVAGSGGEKVEGARVRPPEGVAGWVAYHRRSLLLNGTEELRRFFPEGVEERGIASAVCVPLHLDGDTVGVLNVTRLERSNLSPFDDRQRKLLAIFADYAAGTIRNLRTLSELSEAHGRLEKTCRQAEEYQDQLVQSEKLSTLGQLVSEVAHELNSPLTATIGYAQLLEKENRDPRVAEHLRTIREEGMRCQKIVRNLLTFARRSRGERSAVRVNELVRRAVELRRYHLRNGNVGVEMELATGLPPISADPNCLQQVFLNLLNNAVHAIEETGRGGRVHLETRALEAAGSVIVRVSDDGPGIPPGFEERIFEPFYTSKAAGKGTGLGLPVCRGIVQDLGGAIEVSGNRDGGATFTITLPVPESEIPEAASDESSGRICRGLRILVVDDDVAVLDLLKSALELEGQIVSTVGSLDAAVAAARHTEFDVILTDLRMPGGSGLDLLEKLRSDKPALAERVVFLTGTLEDPECRRALQKTGRPALAKPFSLDELRRLVRRTALGPIPVTQRN